MSVAYEKAECVCFVYMQQQKMKFKSVKMNMKQVLYHSIHTKYQVLHVFGFLKLVDKIFPLDIFKAGLTAICILETWRLMLWANNGDLMKCRIY